MQGMLFAVSPSLPASESVQWAEVTGRAVYAGQLITDVNTGKLNLLVEHAYPGQRGAHPEFGQDILALARAL